MLGFRKNKTPDKKVEAIGTHLLETCRRSSPSLNRIASLVESCPEAVNFKDAEGRLALHLACSSQPSLEVVQFLVVHSSDSIKQVTGKGMMPLHYACRESASFPVIQYLVQQYEDALKHPTQSDWLPLHLACAKQAPLEVIDFLVRSWSNSLKVATQDGKLALHFACANHAPVTAIRFLVQYYSESIRVKDANERTPLHIACAYSSDLELYKYLVETWKDGLKERGMKGLIPLHVACYERQPLEVIQFLVNGWERSLHQYDKAKNLPLHAAIKSNCSKEVIMFLIRAWPKSVDSLGDTPQEIASYIASSTGRSQTSELFHWIEKTFLKPGSNNEFNHVFVSPSGDAISDNAMPNIPNDNALPVQDVETIQKAGENLHYACEVPQSLDTIKDLLESSPKAIEHKAYGILPIHTACLNQAPVKVIAFLSNSYPRSLEKRDNDGNLPIHLACYSGAPLDSIKYLVEMWPESLDEKNSSQNTPIERAMHPFYDNPDDEVILWLKTTRESSSSQALRLPGNEPRYENRAACEDPSAIEVMVDERAIRLEHRPEPIPAPSSSPSRRASLPNHIGVEEHPGERQVLLTPDQNTRSKATPFVLPKLRSSGLSRDFPGHARAAESDQVPQLNPPLQDSGQHIETARIKPPTSASSFYRTAVEDSKLMGQEVEVKLDNMNLQLQNDSHLEAVVQDDGNSRPSSTNCMNNGGVASSFYRSAIEESQLMQNRPTPSQPNDPLLPMVVIDEDESSSRLHPDNNRGVARQNRGTQARATRQTPRNLPQPPLAANDSSVFSSNANEGGVASSFYRTAIEESEMNQGVHSGPSVANSASNDYSYTGSNEQRMFGESNQSVPGSFYRAAITASREEASDTDFNPPNPPNYQASPTNRVRRSLELNTGQGVESSFYRAAIAGSQQENLTAAPGMPNPSNYQPVPNRARRSLERHTSRGVESSFYRAAIAGSQQENSTGAPDIYRPEILHEEDPEQKRPGIVHVDEPAMRPDSAMYRAAYGNQNGRLYHP